MKKLGNMFPILFVTVACGAISGFPTAWYPPTLLPRQSQMKRICSRLVTAQWFLKAFWPLSLSALQVLLHLLTAHRLQAPRSGILQRRCRLPEMFGIPLYVAQCFMTMCVSALALTSPDAVARIGPYELPWSCSLLMIWLLAPLWRKVLCNKYFSTVLTLLCGFVLTCIGYANIWPLFGSANSCSPPPWYL